MITYSAPAKVILSGEHSVIYTKPAFVTAVDLRLAVSITAGITENKQSDLHKRVHYCDTIVETYLKKKDKARVFAPFQYSYTSSIPEGRGMGSSAAFCVATVAALLHYYTDHEPDKQTISSLAYQCEKYFHGIPSGVDVSASCYGGLIFYRKEFEFLKTISALNFKIPKSFQEKIILIDTGKPVETTKEMVSYVGKRYNENPKKMEKTLSEIEKVTKRMVVSIVKEDLSMFMECITDNERLLETFGIVSKQTKMLLKDLEPYGVGKVTGAGGISGGSGFVIFVMKDQSVKEYLNKKEVSFLHFHPDYNGVKLL